MADRRIRVFHTVAKHLSFTKAAEVLFMSQPAVTFQIRQLEEQLDARLFDRTSRGIALTPEGAVALEYAERMLGMSKELKTRLKEMSGRIGGQLLIGASTAYADYLMPQVLAQFKARYPAVVPRLLIANSETIQARLLDRSLSIGFIDGESEQPALRTEPCCHSELFFVCAPSHALAREKSMTAELLARHAYVSREAGSGTRLAVDRYLQHCGLSPGVLQIVTETSCPDSIKALVTARVGFSIMPRSSVRREVKLGELCAVPLSPPLVRPLSVVYPREKMYSRLINGFLSFAKERIASMHPTEEIALIPKPGADPKTTTKETTKAARNGERAAAPRAPQS